MSSITAARASVKSSAKLEVYYQAWARLLNAVAECRDAAEAFGELDPEGYNVARFDRINAERQQQFKTGPKAMTAAQRDAVGVAAVCRWAADSLDGIAGSQRGYELL